MKETLVQMIKCSVIIPLYRGKEYIEDCIKSLSVQTYSDFELILMDDGSPDDTYDFVAEVLKKFPTLNARLFRQENSGVARTRNKCVTLATGEYVAFMDQDDTVMPDYLETLMKQTESGECDIALCGYVRRTDEGKILKTVSLCEDSFSKYRIVAPWARIYRRAFLLDNGLEFLPTACGEDTYLTLQAYALTENIRIACGYTGYVWRYNPSSVSNTKQRSVKIADDACDTFEKIVAVLPSERHSKREDEEYFFIRACLFYLLFSSHAEKASDVDYAYNRYFSFLEKNFPNYMKNPLIGIAKPKSESASVRCTVWGFLLLKRLGLGKAFARLWSKLH